MADLTVKTTEIIDGIKLSNNSIGYINYNSLKNKPVSDTTLATAGKFADAKITGDKLKLIFTSVTASDPALQQTFVNKVLRSKNYAAGTYTDGVGYSKTGLWIDMTTGVIHAPGLYTTADSNAHIKGDVTGNVKGNVTGNVNGNVTGNVTGNINGEITATKLTLNSGVTIPASKISGLSTSIANTISSEYLKLGTKYNSSTNSILISSKGELNVTGASIDGMIHGLLTGEFSGKATITDGTIGSCYFTGNGIFVVPAGTISFNNNSTLHGTNGVIDLSNGTIEIKDVATCAGVVTNRILAPMYNKDTIVKILFDNQNNYITMNAKKIIFNSDLTVNKNLTVSTNLTVNKDINVKGTATIEALQIGGVNTISDSNIYFGDKITAENMTLNGKIICNGFDDDKGSIQFYDYFEIAVAKGEYTPKDGLDHPFHRCPVASVTTNGARVAFLRTRTYNGKKQLGVKGQWGTDINGEGNKLSDVGNWETKNITIDGESDIRLKENIRNSSVNALQAVLNMPVREFDWKESKIHQPLGLVADEIEPLDPLLTIGGGYNSDGSMDVKNIDRLLLTEYAIKAIQEQQEIINKQQKEINVLKQTLNIN